MSQAQPFSDNDTFPPTYSDSSLQQAQTALYSTPNPESTIPERPPSPPPSYHTIAPSTHTTLDSSALTRAALETPNAVLSKLNVTNNVQNQGNSSANTSRFISVRTDPDGKERYYISFRPTRASQASRAAGQEMQIFKADAASGGHIALATTTISSSGANIVHADGETIQADFASLQESGRLPLRLSVDGQKREFYWEVVLSRSSDESSQEEQSQQQQRSKAARPIFGIQSQRKKDIMQRIIGMRLIDSVNGDVWAGYIHSASRNAGDIKSISRTGRWGFVEVKARAMRLDDGVDRAFVALISLQESYVRLWGEEGAPAEKWEALAGAVLFCSVM